jgi:hypothetical protein
MIRITEPRKIGNRNKAPSPIFGRIAMKMQDAIEIGKMIR